MAIASSTRRTENQPPQNTENLTRPLEEAARLQMATVIFGAKEAFYKCQYPLSRRFLEFEDIIVHTVGDAFEVSVVEATYSIHRLSPWIGRFKVDEALVVAGIAAERYGRSWPAA
jgi:4'-phosphopantetheinyl transferase EntD